MIPIQASIHSLKGQRILVAAEYIGHGGTRRYFRDLLAFYADAGADVTALTTYEFPDLEMRQFVSDFSFKLLTFQEAVREFGTRDQALRPSVWNRRLVAQESDFFSRVCDALGIERVVLSVGTSGLFLSATPVRPDPLLIAHGYPHGNRQRFLGRRVLGPLMPPCLRIVTVSDYSSGLFRNAWGTQARGVDVRTVRSTTGPLLPGASLQHKRALVVTAALLEAYKEPYTWIEIAQQVLRIPSGGETPDFLWMGVGDLLDSARARVPQPMEKSIRFPGWIENPGEVYARARVYLQTSSKESLGLSVVDALRHGLPAVVTSAGGLPEVVINGLNGFVVPVGDTRSASDAIRELLADDRLWSSMSAAAQEVYAARFSPESWRRGLMDAHDPRSRNLE